MDMLEKENETPMERALVSRVSKKELSRWVEENALAYKELMAYYRTAAAMMEAKIQRARDELLLDYGSDPVKDVATQIKSADEIVDQLLAAGAPLTVENIEKNFHDIVALDVTCLFPAELYLFADAVLRDKDVSLLHRDDMVAAPRENGYRALCLVLSVPITLRGQTRNVKVELRLQTGVMKLWSSIEQKLRQKKDIIAPEQVRQELVSCSEIGAELDARLEQIRYNIDHRVITK